MSHAPTPGTPFAESVSPFPLLMLCIPHERALTWPGAWRSCSAATRVYLREQRLRLLRWAWVGESSGGLGQKAGVPRQPPGAAPLPLHRGGALTCPRGACPGTAF